MVHANEIRKKFLDFFEKRGHTIVPSSSLVPDDPSVLLTTAGMQQFKPYYSELDPETAMHPSIGKPVGKNAASVQKSFRTSDIDEVGDESHLTFFEMLGNFSFGGYFKKEAIQYAYEFITSKEWMGLDIEYVTVFKGDPSTHSVRSGQAVPADTESEEIWKSLGITNIKKLDREDNFWGPTGTEGPCGPTTEIYVKSTNGKDIEVWNIVFNEFYCSSDTSLTPLKTPGVDTGMGLERLAMVAQHVPTIFDTDLFKSLLEKIPSSLHVARQRIIVDHIRAICFLVADGVRPSNRDAGYVLRRLLRRLIAYEKTEESVSKNILLPLFDEVINMYAHFYSEVDESKDGIHSVFENERDKFLTILPAGLKFLRTEAKKHKPEMKKAKEGIPERANELPGNIAFDARQSYGLTQEIIGEELATLGFMYNEEEYKKSFEKHQEISKRGQEKKFGGHGLVLNTGELKAANEEEVKKVTRLHTATHLLQASLRKILGDDVRQAGSDITAERTRFDFTFPRKVTKEELQQVEDMANEVIARGFDVIMEETTYEDAMKKGALAFFKEKYPERVTVYSVIGNDGEVFSRELCGGPHVRHTKEIGHITILKEESSAAGIRRIRATVAP